MGCGNSSPTNTNSSSSSSSNPAGHTEASSKVSEDLGPEDDKWKNYGGVYVGFPTDPSNIPQVQIGSLRGATEEFTYRGEEKRLQVFSRSSASSQTYHPAAGGANQCRFHWKGLQGAQRHLVYLDVDS